MRAAGPVLVRDRILWSRTQVCCCAGKMIPVHCCPVVVHVLGVRIIQIQVGHPRSRVPTLQIGRRGGIDFITTHPGGGHAETKTECGAMHGHAVHGREVVLARFHLGRIGKGQKFGCHVGRGKGGDRAHVFERRGSDFVLIRGGRSYGPAAHHVHHGSAIHERHGAVGDPAVDIREIRVGDFPSGAVEQLDQNGNILQQFLTIRPCVGNVVVEDEGIIGIPTVPAGHRRKHTVSIPIERIVAAQIALGLIEQKASADHIIGLGIDGVTGGIVPKPFDGRRVGAEQDALHCGDERRVGSVCAGQGTPPKIGFEVHAVRSEIVNRFDVVRDLACGQRAGIGEEKNRRVVECLGPGDFPVIPVSEDRSGRGVGIRCQPVQSGGSGGKQGGILVESTGRYRIGLSHVFQPLERIRDVP